MNKFSCKNCNLEFDADDASQCPRCSSAKINRAGFLKLEKTEEPKRRVVYGPTVVTDTKESWMRFHASSDQQKCPACGASDFEMNWKKREKTCQKCGEILPLRRR